MNTAAYDTEWFETYISKCSFDDINYIKFDQKNLQQQKELFFAGDIDEPTLLYKDFRKQIANHKRELENFREMIERDKNQLFAVRQIYYQKIAKQLNKIALLEAMYTGDDEKFTEISLKLYGELDKNLVRKALSTLLMVAKNNGHVISSSMQELVTYFGASEEEPVASYEQLDKTKVVLSAEKIVEIFKENLRNKKIPWQVRACNESLVINVCYTDNTLYIPTSRRMTRVEAEALIEHEVNVHLQRYTNGSKSNLQLLSIGLDGYIKGEEGIATYKQCLIDKSLPSVDTYICIGLARGLYDGKAQSFREIFNFLKEYFQIIKTPENEIDDLAWKKTLRMFRGVTGKTGACFTRGVIYFEGFVKIKEMIDSGHKEVDRFMVGKYDPSNLNHVGFLDELGIK